MEPTSKKEFPDEVTVFPGNLKANLRTPSISSDRSLVVPELTNTPGFRAAEAYVRPAPIAVIGRRAQYGFDLRNCVFTMKIDADESASHDKATEIFLPDFHFPKDSCEITVSSGKWAISTDEENGGMIQKLKWWHAEGEQDIRVVRVQRRQNMMIRNEEEEGYLEQCQQSKCTVM